MRKIITIKENTLYLDEQEIDLTEVLISFDSRGLQGIYRADYLIQMIMDYKGIPSKIGIAKKLGKYKINGKK